MGLRYKKNWFCDRLTIWRAERGRIGSSGLNQFHYALKLLFFALLTSTQITYLLSFNSKSVINLYFDAQLTYIGPERSI